MGWPRRPCLRRWTLWAELDLFWRLMSRWDWLIPNVDGREFQVGMFKWLGAVDTLMTWVAACQSPHCAANEPSWDLPEI
jgi:hypothetical protein